MSDSKKGGNRKGDLGQPENTDWQSVQSHCKAMAEMIFNKLIKGIYFFRKPFRSGIAMLIEKAGIHYFLHLFFSFIFYFCYLRQPETLMGNLSGSLSNKIEASVI